MNSSNMDMITPQRDSFWLRQEKRKKWSCNSRLATRKNRMIVIGKSIASTRIAASKNSKEWKIRITSLSKSYPSQSRQSNFKFDTGQKLSLLMEMALHSGEAKLSMNFSFFSRLLLQEFSYLSHHTATRMEILCNQLQ